MVLNDVRHVQDIRLNLISTGRLKDQGYNGSFKNEIWKFCKGNLIVAHAKKQNILYVLYAQLCRYGNRHNRRVVAQDAMPYDSKGNVDVGQERSPVTDKKTCI